MVPFLHITTRIEGRPHERLLSQMGGTGFPTLMFLDPAGRKLLKYQGPRNVRGFEETLGNIDDYMVLVKKVQDGNTALAGRLLIRQIEMGMLSYEEVEERIKALEKIYAEELGKDSSSTNRARIQAERKRLAEMKVDLEVRSIVTDAGRDDKKHLDAGRYFLDMWKKEQRLPSGEEAQYEFWRHLAHYADVERDKALFQEVVEQYRIHLGKSRNYSRMLVLLQRRLDEWDD